MLQFKTQIIGMLTARSSGQWFKWPGR